MKKRSILIFLLLLFSFAIEGFLIQVSSGENENLPPYTPRGRVTIDWKEILFRVCPPGILDKNPCEFPNVDEIIKKFSDLILQYSPYVLTILIILGGFMYLLSPIKFEQIQKGHRYIQYAIYGYILLLLVSTIFTIISVILGGPTS